MSARPLLASLFVLAACSSPPPPSEAPAGPLGRAFDASAQANGVPRDLLVAIAQTEGALALPRTRRVDPDAAVPAAGPLQLRHGKLDTLARGAALMRSTELALREDSDQALEAGARVLAEVGGRTGARAGELTSWSAAIEEMSGYADDVHRRAYAHRVFALLARGGTFAGRDGEPIAIAGHDVPMSAWAEIDTRVHALANAEYPQAEWFPIDCTNKCEIGRSGATVGYVVIHDTEGSWDASVATLQNDPMKSVHYIVGTDGRVGQFVHESDTAWHAGNRWYNEHSVGIEHVGYSTEPYPTAQYASSAQLVRYLLAKYPVQVDRAHVIGHDQVPNGNVLPVDTAPCSESPASCESGSDWGGAANHRDPGIWEWCTYMQRIGGACKCDDTTSRLSCSTDGTKAFRCKGGTVDVYACTGGCTAQTAPADDTCGGEGPVVGADGGVNADAGAPSASTPADDASAPVGDPTSPPSSQSWPQASSGCSYAASGPGSNAPSRLGGPGGLGGLAWFGIAIVAARTRRKKRATR